MGKIIDPSTNKPFDSFGPPSNDYLGGLPIAPQATYSAIYNTGSHVYRSRFDEALKVSLQDAATMRRDGFIDMLLRARWLPTCQAPWHLIPDDQDDSSQVELCDNVTTIIKQIPRWQQMLMGCMEATFFGRSAVQLEYNTKIIQGRNYIVPTKHSPIHADKIIWKHYGVPGILVHRGYKPAGATLEYTDRGLALFLYDAFYRDRFIIHRHIPVDQDYFLESDQAGMIEGAGVRHYLFYVWKLRMEVQALIFNGLQRISSNGMLVGYFETGNDAAEKGVIAALKSLLQNNACAFPYPPGKEKPDQFIQHIEASTIAYDVMFEILKYLDGIIRLAILGQELSQTTGHHGTGMGSGVSEFQQKSFEQILRWDTENLAETLNNDLIAPIIKYNFGKQDFNVKIRFELEKPNVKERLEAAKQLYDMGVEMDKESLLEIGGFQAPQKGAPATSAPQPSMNGQSRLKDLKV